MAAPRTDISVVLGLISASSTFFFPISAVLAQITPDATLGSESSIVTPDALVNGAQADLIEGGALRGANVFHSFQDFNVNDGQRVYFGNPTGIENILSRVTGGNVSNILGTLGVDGAANLFLLNPSGVVFGPNATLDVSGSFVVSAADRYAFLDGTDFSATNPGQAPLVTVSIRPGVQFNNTPRGDITNGGNLAVGAGETLSLYGDTVVSSGDLTAAGGTVQVLGNRVALTDQATVDVSSATGGGNVYIGGDYQGQGDLPTAQQAVVEAGVQINADALETGDGGTVIVWADDATRFYGSITARGGGTAGDGGFVEVSGANSLGFWGAVDTTAAFGDRGTLLLDPTNITVVAGVTPDPSANITPDNIWNFAEDAGDQDIGADVIVTLLGLNDLELQASNSITVDAAINAGGTSNNFVLNANNGSGTITLNQNVTTGGTQTYTGNVVLGNDVALASSSGGVSFGGTVNGTQTLTTNTSTGTTFNGIVGGTNALTSLSVTGAATLNTTGITTTGAQTYNNAVTLSSAVTTTGSTIGFGDTLALAGNNLTVSASEADFSGNVSGAGTLTIQPNAVGGNITVGGAGGTAALDLTAAEIGRFQNTLTAINIGRVDGTGTITLSGLADDAFAVATAIAGGATLVGPNDATTWNVTGANAGNLNNDFTNGGLTFQNIEAINGGTGDDAFNLSGGTLSGAVNGGTGTNTLTGNTGANTFTVTGANSGTATGVGSFSNIQALVGNTGTDTFNLSGGSITSLSGAGGIDTFNLTTGSATTVNGDGGNDQFNLGAATVTTVDGGVGTDTVTGSSSGETFQITGGTGASVGGTTLQNIDTLEGGDGNDIFAFNDGVTFAGTIRGGDTVTDTGTDTLNYTAFTSDPNVNLAALGATGIESVQGSTQAGVTSTLTGANIPNLWAVNNPDSGTVNATTSFSNFTNLVGGTSTDTFTLAATGSASNISGGDGVDTFNLNGGTVTTLNGGAGADQFNLNSGSATTVNGNDGGDTFNLGATAVAAIDGGAGAGTDTISGTTGNDRFQVSGSETGTVTQTNGTATTTTFQEIEGLNGVLGDDTFAFNDGVTTTAIAIDGGGNTDTLDFSAYTVDPNVDLSVVGTNIETVTGTTIPAVTTLIGFAAANTWNITGANSGTATDGTTTLSFSNFNTLMGNGNGDTFNLNGGTVTTLNGAGGADTFNLTSGTVTTVNGDGAADTVVLNGATVTTLNGGDGGDIFTLTSGTVSGGVNGNDGGDTFNLGATAVAAIDGGADNDAINGTAGNDRFQVSGSETGTVTQTNGSATNTTFQEIENLAGAFGNDTFAFNDTVDTTAIAIDGGGPGDTDTLDFSAYSTDPAVNLAIVGNSIENVIGTTTPTVTTLIGFAAANTWNISGLNSGTASDGGTTLSFSNFNTLTGNTNGDTFNLNGGTVATLNGAGGGDSFNLNSGTVTTVNGNAGQDTFTLNGATVTTLVGGEGATDNDTLQGTTGNDSVTLTGNEAGTVNGSTGFSEIENFAGNGGDTTLVGTAGDDTLTLQALGVGVVLQGVAFDAIASFDGSDGNDTIVGSTGDDRFQITGTSTGQITQVNGVALATALGFQNVENLDGANGNDTFAFNNGISSTAVGIDGGGGALDTLDFSAYTSNFSVDLSAVGTGIEVVDGSVQPTVTAATLLGFNGPTTWTVNGLIAVAT
ncbi:MAG: filamentous hemagglutinin N-terminal domain-containing protein [Cyanobacteria bacterium]|nr:filamentous hemagglutinin N-terminal domain-containing protein [Cyanobacteriota bacterium]